MESVAHFLDAADTGLHVMLDERTEYEAEMAYYNDAGDARRIFKWMAMAHSLIGD